MDLIWLTKHEASIRLAAYLSVLLLMAIWEHFSMARPTTDSKVWRWSNNIALAWTGGILVRLILPATAVSIATYAQKNGIGIMQQMPLWLNIILSIIVLDFIIYWQHRIFHRIPWLWRLHGTHHLDSSLDASTGARFHPIEIFLSMLIKVSAILILGCSPLAVLSFEVILNATATFNHSNINLHPRLNKLLRPWLVVPEMHRVHHSTKPVETHSNFGFCLCFWDKLFKSYRILTNEEQNKMSIGLPAASTNTTNKKYKQDLVSLLLFPLKYKP